MPLNLLVEGWRSVPHSYAMVNQWQLLAFSKRQDVRIRVLDRPLPSHWRRVVGLFDPEEQRALAAMRQPTSDFTADVVFRLVWPYDFAPASRGIVAVFGTAEAKAVPAPNFVDVAAARRACESPQFLVITPSRWSAAGFETFGFPRERVAVIPHGVDTGIFRPRADVREAIRKQMGIREFTFVSVGAMTWNKGIDFLLRAFAAVAETNPHVQLLLKGVDGLYPSRRLLDEHLKALPPTQAALVAERLVYVGLSNSTRQMGQFYAAGDVYVSPYRAEGFNLPVLEAMACGLPVICTKGGSTDDFINSNCARTIDSKTIPHPLGGEGYVLEPNVEHLIELMRSAMVDDHWQRIALTEGPPYVANRYTWNGAVEQLIGLFRSAVGLSSHAISSQYAPVVPLGKLFSKRTRLRMTRAASTRRNTERLANKIIKFTFSPSPETSLINYFTDNLSDDSASLAADGFQFVPSEHIEAVDLIIMTAHGSDLYDHITAMRQMANPETLIAVWLWKNHLAHLQNLRTCAAADYVFPAHGHQLEYLDRHWIKMMHLPLCSAQWSLAEAAKSFPPEFAGSSRSDKLLVNYVDYPESWRSQLLKKIKSDLSQAEVLLMGPDDGMRYFGKTREDRAKEWLEYKSSIMLPVEKDLSTRVFDALLAGQVILVPVDMPDLDKVMPPDVQARLGILRLPDLEISTISKIAAQAVRLYDEGGELGALARHKYILENHMLVHRVKAILERIKSIANETSQTVF